MNNFIYPIIIYLDGNFVVANDQWDRVSGARVVGNIFSYIENRVRKAKSGWIIDYSGHFYELKYSSKKHEWLRPIAILWNFVRSEYIISPQRKITVGEVKEILSRLPKATMKKEQASDFLSFLREEDETSEITKDLLDRWPI